MRIIQTVNDTIRLLFNPKTEVFRLSDFLLVRDMEENFLAQVVEVYDDKFDQESNVAKIKLIYRIVNGNEIAPFDNYTPSRECEVAKIKQSEIEKCINLNKKTIPLGTSYLSKEKMNINTDFFTNNCVIFADKFEQTNQIFENLAPRLSQIKPVLVLDFSGSCKFEGVAPFVASENFRLPLSSKTIDYIQQKTLIRAKLETQVVLGDVFEEVKKFLETSEEDYVPFQKFIKVVQSQCKQTPSIELLVLISWLKKYSREGIFAKNKREFEGVKKSLLKNKITSVDLSNIKTEWQKEHIEYIINNIENDVFVLIRLNDNNINNDLINLIYLKKPNISFIPSFSYGYKKASGVLDFAQNYLLMPTLNPKRDFSHANFQIQSLNKESYMIFGEDTKDFIFTLENETPVKKKNENENEGTKAFISLNLQLEDMTPLELRPNNFEIKHVEPKKKRLHEEIKLSDVLSLKEDTNKIEDIKEKEPKKEEENIPDEKPENITQTATTELVENKEEAPVEIEPENKETAEETQKDENDILGEDELDYFEQEEIAESKEEKEEEPNPDNAEIDKVEEIKENVEEKIEEEKPSLKNDLPKIKTEEKIAEEEEIENKEPKNELEAFAMTQSDDEADEEETESDAKDDSAEELIEEAEEKTPENKSDEEIIQKETTEAEKLEDEIEKADKSVSNIIDKAFEDDIENKKDEAIEKLDEMAKKEDDELDKQFNEIMEETEEQENSSSILKINDSVTIDLDKIKNEAKKPENKLPVFDDENENTVSPSEFKEGDKVSHETYGEGEIIKSIQYGTRCLLQIEFPKVGKRLLDPKIAKLKHLED